MVFRKGDKVSITGTIKYRPKPDEHIFIEVDGKTDDVWIHPNFVTLVEPFFEPGDECTFQVQGYGEKTGTVLASSGGHAWIDLGGGEYCTRTLGSIQRVESFPEKDESDD